MASDEFSSRAARLLGALDGGGGPPGSSWSLNATGAPLFKGGAEADSSEEDEDEGDAHHSLPGAAGSDEEEEAEYKVSMLCGVSCSCCLR
jgi:hypothetical protein